MEHPLIIFNFNIFYWLSTTVVPFFLPFIPFCHAAPLPPSFPHLSSCPWVVYISSLASPFPILFLTFPCLFCTYHLCFLFPVPSPPHPLPAENPPCDLHFGESGTSTLENSLEFLRKLKKLVYQMALPFTLRYSSKEMKQYTNTKICTWMLITVLFVIVK